MEISFKSRKLAKQFNSQNELVRNFGAYQAKKISIRLSELQAAANLHDFWPPKSGPSRCHELNQGKRRGQISVDLEYPYRLIFAPDHDPVPTSDDGGLDWYKVTAVLILGVENTHE